jgi:hypothetical protein
VVDVKLAFEGGPDIDRAFIDSPEFRGVGAFRVPEMFIGRYDIYKNVHCAYKWCYGRRCNSNTYTSLQHAIQSFIGAKVRNILEECETESQRGKNNIESIKQLLKDNDLIRLLPGELPGFALRNRKWGK